ncbi:MAG: ATP-dependent zinc metalloprotease FtsH [Spirochaetaceae bacterium]|nr:ATP-dependent zinc metalloprotease FtsH [Spirochaetaceae bacterium]
MTDPDDRGRPTPAGSNGQWRFGQPPKSDGGRQEEPPLIKPPSRGQFRFSLWYIVIAAALLLLFNSLFSSQQDASMVEYSTFKALVSNGQIKRVRITEDQYIGYNVTEQELTRLQDSGAASPSNILEWRAVRVDDPGFVELLDQQGVQYYAVPQGNRPLLGLVLQWVIPLGLMFLVWRFMFKRLGSMGSNVMAFGKSRAQVVAEGETGVRFADVAGADEAKAELEEVVDFLKNPDRYVEIGGKIPKGVLLVGAPGTGKTLLARAVAGEAEVTFFRLNGADFVEMFVGVGAARVRDLFKQAREKSPCIIFIDELDAIGKSRGVTIAGGNDEREQTLNQLLVEMDGFDARSGVIILGATNRPEVLDAALLRPGRFDRQVLVDKPDLSGREAILKIHSAEVKLAPEVDLLEVARATPGFAGADLANIVNEAALLAVRARRKTVAQSDFSEAIDKVVAGLEKRSRVLNPKEKRIVAYHEAGHALIACHTPDADPVRKISIVPRGIGALGYTMQTPAEDRFLLTERDILGRIDVLLGGRGAEQVVFAEISTGAANDLDRATDMAKRMVTDYGMSEKFANVRLPYRQESPLLGQAGYVINREYSESTQQYIDEETARIISERYQTVLNLLREQRPALEAVAARLLETEVVEAAEFAELVGSAARNGTGSA